MILETPTHLLGRLNIGREEFLQRLLTMLVVAGPYPRWNTRSVPSAQGLAFLRGLYESTTGETWPGDDVEFVDEFELPPARDGERGGAPDYALVWPDRLWLIELKTEKGSHRKDQIATYLELARHHYPGAAVGLLYITPPMSVVGPAAPTFVHTTWDAVASLVASAWAEAGDLQPQVQGLLSAIEDLHMRPSEWRVKASIDAPAADWLSIALYAASATAVDGRQRGIEAHVPTLQDLMELRLQLRRHLAASPAQSDLQRVVPWIWRVASTGEPLTEMGCERGMELRVSRRTCR